MDTTPLTLEELIDRSANSNSFELRMATRDACDLAYYSIFPFIIDEGRVLRASLLALRENLNG